MWFFQPLLLGGAQLQGGAPAASSTWMGRRGSRPRDRSK
ncbi:hypothetical protein [Caudoviricetes sp.]|nr:hypothetical protein [Caudoviricetes sp.]